MTRRLRSIASAMVSVCVGAAAVAGCGATDDSAVTVGAVLPLTGDFATYGGPIRQAADLAVERVNASGGIRIGDRNYDLKLRVYDDATTPEKSMPSLFPQAVLRDGSPLLITAWNSANIAPFLEDNPVPVIDVLAATYDPPVNSLDPNIFLLRPYTPDIVPGVGQYLADHYHAKTIAFLGPNEPFANGQLSSLEKTAADHGLQLSDKVQYPADATDLSSFIRSVRRTAPDAIHIGGSTQAVAPAITQLRQSGFDKPITMYTGMTPDQARDLIGSGVYNTVMAGVYEFEGVTPQTNPVPEAAQFGRDFEERYHTCGIDLVQWAYDAIWIAKAAMEKAGSSTDRAAIRQALTELTVPDQTITGWTKHDGDRLFNADRQARSLSVALGWNTQTATWDPKMYFTAGLPDQSVSIVDLESQELGGVR
ncbi:ABC transporter substrate-binding protein [Mycobacterium sp. 21AC1]|uniref:ABC transporter substrate-binding protein n=1 Tax=[Mycobacterium] appelbergii TaxID=2939269 RepID=UPI002938DED6|nr:ABC transporter substrate-binding protein [Mycobacterium sp. 21AC1]MDV3126982.1 ABC transporter substrate-binding protein [Mycobacterium sp. 21AC1]